MNITEKIVKSNYLVLAEGMIDQLKAKLKEELVNKNYIEDVFAEEMNKVQSVVGTLERSNRDLKMRIQSLSVGPETKNRSTETKGITATSVGTCTMDILADVGNHRNHSVSTISSGGMGLPLGESSMKLDDVDD